MKAVVRVRILLLATTCLPFAANPAVAQNTPRATKTGGADSAAVARGWTLLAGGDKSEASKVATDLQSRYPGSVAVLALALDVEIARAGAIAGLDTYERWLGTRTADDVYGVRRVASALLHEIAATDRDRPSRLAAIEALLADGDVEAAALLPAPDAAAPAENAVRGATGTAGAVDALIALATQPGPGRRTAVSALGRSRNPRATPILLEALTDPDPTVRTASAEALGALPTATAVSRLKPLLNDPVVGVRLAAAGSLLALNDSSGMPLLRQLQTSEYPAIRLAAARAAAKEAGPEWTAVVRELTKDSDPDVRRQAAELIGPYEPELAKATLEPLLNDPNPAMRQAAADSYVSSTADVAVLRRYLRNPDSGTRVKAADRVLQLTR
jgi:HEAT repeat protein